MVLGMFSIDADLPSTEKDTRVDWLGAVLVTAGLVLIVFVLSEGEIAGWKTPCASCHLQHTLLHRLTLSSVRYHCAAHRRCHLHGPLRLMGALPRTRTREPLGRGYQVQMDPSTTDEDFHLGTCQGEVRSGNAHCLPQLECLLGMAILGSGGPVSWCWNLDRADGHGTGSYITKTISIYHRS